MDPVDSVSREDRTMGPSGQCDQGGPHNGRPAALMYMRPIRAHTLALSAQLVSSFSCCFHDCGSYKINLFLQKTERGKVENRISAKTDILAFSRIAYFFKLSTSWSQSFSHLSFFFILITFFFIPVPYAYLSF